MGAIGSSADDALAESFNATFKRETLQGRESWPNEREARLDAFRWLHRYNTRRRHSRDAIEPLLRAAAISGSADQRQATAMALLRLGFGLGERQGFADALRVHIRAAAIFDELGDVEHELQCRILTGICASTSGRSRTRRLRGGRWASHRRIINGILYRQRAGVPWRDLPARFGPWKTVYERHQRWSADGTWDRTF